MKKIFLVLTTILTMSNVLNVKAKTITSEALEYQYIDMQNEIREFYMYFLDEEVVYSLPESVSGNVLNEVLLDAYFGYGYENHTTDEWYIATQVAIWNALGLSISGDINESYLKELEDLISDYLPTFTTSYTLGINDTLKITDNYLSNYSLKEVRNNITLSENTLTIKTNSAETTSVELISKTKLERFGKYYELYDEYLIPGDFYNTLTVDYEAIYGTLEMKVYETDGSCTSNISNLVIGLYDSSRNLITELHFDSNCMATYENLEIGTYYIEGLTDLYGYEINDFSDMFLVTRWSIINNFHCTKYLMKIIKDVSLNVKLNSNEGYLNDTDAGFEFVSDDYSEVLYANSGGNIYTMLPYGTYTVKQISGNSSYEYTNPFTLVIDDETEIVELEIINELKKPSLTIKVENNESCVIGGVYNLYNDEGLVKTVTMDACEVVIDNLEQGHYFLKEITNVIGYEESNTYEFDLIDNYELIISKTLKDVNVKIVLNADGVSVNNITFNLLKDNEITHVLSTDEQGVITTTLNYGTYTLVQVDTITNYQKSEDITFTIASDDDATIEVMNVPIYGKLNISTITNGKSIYLEGIKYQIYDTVREKYICVNEECTFKTNIFGTISIDNLYPSTYEITIINDEYEGYLSSDEIVVITLNGEEKEISYTLEKVTGRITIYKATSDNYTLEGILVGLYAKETIYDTDKQILYEQDELISEGITDIYGVVSFTNLPLGSYYVKDIKVPDGYLLDTAVYDVTLDYIDSETKVVTKEILLINYAVPNTLKEYSYIFPLEIIFAFLGSFLCYQKRKVDVKNS